MKHKSHKKHKKGRVIKAYSRTTSPKSKDIGRDASRKAMRPGKRISRYGNVYYETRGNRSDSEPKRGLERGGILKRLFKH